VKTLLIAAALFLAAAPAAQAARWKQVTATGGGSIDQVGLLRTPDGVLHVAWHKGPDLFHTAIARSGKVGATTPIQTGWTGFSDASLTAVPGGIRAFWGAIRSTDSSDPQIGLNTALSTDGGASWQLQPGSIVPGGGQAYGSDVVATALPNGSTLQAWAGTLGTWVHAGLDPATPNTDYQGALGPYGYDPGIASDASGRTMMAWFSSSTSHLGVLAQAVNPDGTPAGPPATMPGSDVLEGGGTLARTPIVARARSGGFYVGYAVGYPTADDVRVWKVGAPSAVRLARTESNADVTLAADPKGRLWAVWSEGGFGNTRVRAARSNRAATRFGAAVNAGAVKNANGVYSLDASATASALDVLALFGVGTVSGGSTYVTRVRPGLTLKARRAKGRVKFTVLDAGDPVKGAKVKLGGRSARTDRKGRATLRFEKGRATARAAGYTRAKLRVR
jgi:hypothetical protein